MRIILILWAGLCGVTVASAESSQPAPANQPARPPVVIIVPPVLTSPPPPHERQYVPPPASRAPPMERVEPLPPMLPRVGN